MQFLLLLYGLTVTKFHFSIFIAVDILNLFLLQFQRQGVDISNEEQKSALGIDSHMIKVEKADDKNTENPFGDDDWEDENDEWE